MVTTKAIASKLDRAANKLQPALRLLGQLEEHLEPGTEGFRIRNELETELLRLEAELGVVTQASLFDETELLRLEAELGVVTRNAGCDRCGTCDRLPNSKLCAGCIQDDFSRAELEKDHDDEPTDADVDYKAHPFAAELDGAEDMPEPASATITFLVDCDFCGKECLAAGSKHVCEHCGGTFEITD